MGFPDTAIGFFCMYDAGDHINRSGAQWAYTFARYSCATEKVFETNNKNNNKNAQCGQCDDRATTADLVEVQVVVIY
jgi:hypothetical protein